MSYALIVAGVVAVGSAAYGAAESSNQKRRAKHKLQELERNKPVDVIPTELLQNQEMAKLRSNTGLPSEQYNMAMQNIMRQQQRALRGGSDRKMGLNLVSTLDDNAQRAQGNLDSANAQARLQNQSQLMNVNNQVTNYKKGMYDRKMSDWNNQYDYGMGLLGQANQNRVNTITSAINAAGTIAGAAIKSNNSNSGFTNSLFGGRRKMYGTGGTGVGGDPNGGNLRLDEYGNLIQ